MFLGRAALLGAMGLQWDPEDDILSVKIKANVTPLTKRGVLQGNHSNFDPLGFSFVVLLKGKKIFQELCSYPNLDWDDPIPQ